MKTEMKSGIIREKVIDLNDKLNELQIPRYMKEFEDECKSDPNFQFWKTYMQLVEILLDFIRAHREGNWKLQVEALEEIVPWLSVYDHTHYARWAPIYLAQLKTLDQTFPEVYHEFIKGNFVAKRTKNAFNQVPFDQATEWMNKLCKLANGVIGITRTDTARDRFCITWTERSRISDETREMFGIEVDDSITTRKDSQVSRLHRDEEDVQSLVEQFKRFNMFSRCKNVPLEPADEENVIDSQMLVSLSTNDIASPEIQEHLLSAKQRGDNLVKTFLTERLIKQTVPFFSPIKRQNSLTFASLYKVVVTTPQNEKKSIKFDRQLIQRLFCAQQAGREVQLQDILSHELSPVPLSLAKNDGLMNFTTKSALMDILTLNISATTPASDIPTCVIIDGHALMHCVGKPADCKTFNDYGEKFSGIVFSQVTPEVKRIVITFDSYRPCSIKYQTRRKREEKRKRPIRKIICDGSTPLPVSWDQYVGLNSNKADLASFLANKLLELACQQLPKGCELITCASPDKVISTMKGELGHLVSNHEEADTLMILHAQEAIRDNEIEQVVVMCRDTDVLVMLIHFFGESSKKVWMAGGTSRDRKFFNINAISANLDKTVRENLVGFHALTGCDTTSSFSGHGKKSSWKIFIQHPHLLQSVGRDGSIEGVEEFVCRLYSASDPSRGIDSVRYEQFLEGKKQLEHLPPTKDALTLHFIRANYQAKIWLQANTTIMDIVNPDETGGWRRDDSNLKIVWTTKSAVPQVCVVLVSCRCKKKCHLPSCKCRRSTPPQLCLPTCGCNGIGCLNPTGKDQ